MLQSRNKLTLQHLLKEQHNLDADLSSFKRTYAGTLLKSDGAFSWTMMAKDIESGLTFEIGSCFPLSKFSRKDTIVEISTSWRDYELIPYTPKEWERCQNERNNSEVY